jgi:hypothetical protein
MSPKQRRLFTDEQKVEAVRIVEQSEGRPSYPIWQDSL